MKHRLVIILLAITSLAKGQERFADFLFDLPDTAKAYPFEMFYETVSANHPIIKQASLLSETARQEIRLARGNFDPKIEAEFLLKNYNDKEYYRLFDGAIKFPTQSPVNPKIGVERNTGEYLNPENYISDAYNYHQLYAGVAIPLGRGLITDEHRTQLQQAKLFSGLMEAEQVKMINKLLVEAAKDYWQWFYSYYNFRLASRNASIAADIFNRVKRNFEGGEAAAIDTVQSRIIYLERVVTRQEAYNEYLNSTIQLSAYLWDAEQNALAIPSSYAPVASSDLLLSQTILQELTEQAKENHPELRKLRIKIEQLELDRQLAREFLKPKLDLSWYYLDQPFSTEGSSTFQMNDNFKLGVDFAFPLFLRKERAKLAQTSIKISSTAYDLELLQRQILNDLTSAHNQLVNTTTVLRQQDEMVNNYAKILEAEMLNLENGESDLFKINIQQEKFFNSQSKLLKLLAEYQKQKAMLYWSAGVQPLRK